MDRASVSEAEGCGFDPRRPHHFPSSPALDSFIQRGYSTNVEYYVLKQGRQEGPFTGADLLNQVATGRFDANDLGQADGERHWVPLRKLISAQGDGEPTPPPLALSRNRQTAAAEERELTEVSEEAEAVAAEENFEIAGKRLWREIVAVVRQLFRQYPLEAGISCFVVACSLLLFSYFRILIVAPALVGALIGGGLAMLRGRVMAGLLLCAAAVFIPAAIWAIFFWAAEFLR